MSQTPLQPPMPGETNPAPKAADRPVRAPRQLSSELPPDEEAIGFLERFRWPLIVVLGGGFAWGASVVLKDDGPAQANKPPVIKIVTIQVTPPPPPPPPSPQPKLQPPPPQEQKLIEQTPVAEEEPKLEEPAPADDPPADPGTNIQGNGPADGFGLSANKGSGGGTGLGLGGRGGKASSRWGWYAAKVQSGIGEALRRNTKTREAVLNHKVRVWPDRQGRITRARLESSTGDASMDAAITAVLTGVQLAEAPPADMPAPILLRLSARRP